MHPVAKQGIVEDLQKLAEMNKEISSALEKLDTLPPRNFFENENKAILNKALHNQKETNKILDNLLNYFYSHLSAKQFK